MVLISLPARLISVNLHVGHGQRAGLCLSEHFLIIVVPTCMGEIQMNILGVGLQQTVLAEVCAV